MNTLIVYFSKYGNTQKVAEAIAGACQVDGNEWVLSLYALRPADLQEADLIIRAAQPTV
jgi:flavodoxin